MLIIFFPRDQRRSFKLRLVAHNSNLQKMSILKCQGIGQTWAIWSLARKSSFSDQSQAATLTESGGCSVWHIIMLRDLLSHQLYSLQWALSHLDLLNLASNSLLLMWSIRVKKQSGFICKNNLTTQNETSKPMKQRNQYRLSKGFISRFMLFWKVTCLDWQFNYFIKKIKTQLIKKDKNITHLAP